MARTVITSCPKCGTKIPLQIKKGSTTVRALCGSCRKIAVNAASN